MGQGVLQTASLDSSRTGGPGSRAASQRDGAHPDVFPAHPPQPPELRR